MNMIEVKNVTMRFRLANDKIQSLKEYFIALITRKLKYKELRVFEKLNFEVKKGEVIGIIGRNGAGKSTLLKIIAGVLAPTEGSVECYGNVVPMLELGSGFDIELSGRENIFLNGSILGYSKKFLEEKYQEIVEFSELGDFIEEPIRNYSSGMLMRLAFSIATIVQPEILIVDEILAVGDEAFQRKSKRKMLELMGGGTTVLFVSHSIDQIREMCNRVVWIENGKIEKVGEPKEICDAYQEYLNPKQDIYQNQNMSLRNTDAYKYIMDVLVIYNNDDLSYYSALARKEQLLVGNICAHELCVMDFKISLVKQFRTFIFINCDPEPLEEFLAEIIMKNKTYITECHTNGLIVKWMELYPESNIVVNQKRAEAGGTCYIPIPVTERLQQVIVWAKYDRDILPARKMSEIEGEQELINYNKSVMEKNRHQEEGIRVGVIVDKKMEISDGFMDEVKKMGMVLRKIPSGQFEDTVREMAKIDYLVDLSEEILARQVNVILCASMGLAYCDKIEELKKEFAGEREPCELKVEDELLYSSISTGIGFSAYIEKQIRKSIVFLFKNLNQIDEYTAILDKAVEAIQRGIDVTIMVSSLQEDNVKYKDTEIPVVNRSAKYVLGSLDTVVVADEEEFTFVITYPNIKKRVYYVTQWAPEKYDFGDFNRIRCSQTYRPCVAVEFWTAKPEIKNWLKEKYDQETIVI